ncbi:MAG: mechanosensitive ion channel protein MscS [Acidimicrobiaceae bacterium]|nr:mechanosensitive ion channel protein MscS [Acidimicrobiaceae bacterium]|tara:strand:- start:1328 stop:2425 length:1098 start_codon:yes stop_codon:yes gene_type:complete
MADTMDPGLVDACGLEPGLTCEWIWDATGNEALASLVEWVIERPLKVVVILVVALVVNRLVKRAIDRMVERLVETRTREENEAEEESSATLSRLGRRARKRIQRIHDQAERARQRAMTLGAVLRSLAGFAVYALAFMIALGELGLDLGPLIAGAGIVGLAVGFGAQSLVADFIAGIFIIIEDQYGVGDYVDVGVASGTVEKVTLRTTVLRDVNGALWVVPNGEIRRVGNSSQLWARTVLDVDVAYDTDIDLAASVIKEVADEVWREEVESATIIEEPEIWGVQNFGADAISIRLAVKTEPGEQWATGRLIRARLKKAFDVKGIEIPFPQRTVWVNQVAERTDAAPTGTEIRDDLLERRSGSDGDE